LNYIIPSGCDPTDPIGKIFKFCEAKTTIAHFKRCLERIDRYDVVEETEELFSEYYLHILHSYKTLYSSGRHYYYYVFMFLVSDIIYFKEQCALAKYPTPEVPNDFDINNITIGEFYLN